MAVVSPFENNESSFPRFGKKPGCRATTKTIRTSNFFIRLLISLPAAHTIGLQANKDEIKKTAAGLIITNILLTYSTLTYYYHYAMITCLIVDDNDLSRLTLHQLALQNRKAADYRRM